MKKLVTLLAVLIMVATPLFAVATASAASSCTNAKPKVSKAGHWSAEDEYGVNFYSTLFYQNCKDSHGKFVKIQSMALEYKGEHGRDCGGKVFKVTYVTMNPDSIAGQNLGAAKIKCNDSTGVMRGYKYLNLTDKKYRPGKGDRCVNVRVNIHFDTPGKHGLNVPKNCIHA